MAQKQDDYQGLFKGLGSRSEEKHTGKKIIPPQPSHLAPIFKNNNGAENYTTESSEKFRPIDPSHMPAHTHTQSNSSTLPMGDRSKQGIDYQSETHQAYPQYTESCYRSPLECRGNMKPSSVELKDRSDGSTAFSSTMKSAYEDPNSRIEEKAHSVFDNKEKTFWQRHHDHNIISNERANGGENPTQFHRKAMKDETFGKQKNIITWE